MSSRTWDSHCFCPLQRLSRMAKETLTILRPGPDAETFLWGSEILPLYTGPQCSGHSDQAGTSPRLSLPQILRIKVSPDPAVPRTRFKTPRLAFLDWVVLKVCVCVCIWGVCVCNKRFPHPCQDVCLLCPSPYLPPGTKPIHK